MSVETVSLGKLGGRGVEGPKIEDLSDGDQMNLDARERIITVEGVWGSPNVVTPAGSAIVPPGSGLKSWKTSKSGPIYPRGGGIRVYVLDLLP